MIGRNVSGGPAANADFLTDENIENRGGHLRESRRTLLWGMLLFFSDIIIK